MIKLFTSSAPIMPAQYEEFDERFVECFADLVFKGFSRSENQLRKSLLTAALRESSDEGMPKPSLVSVVRLIMPEDGVGRYLGDDGVVLELYLRNIDEIEDSLLRRKRGVADKVSYKKAINESIATLRNVRDGSPEISLGRVLYDVDGEGIAKMIEIDQSGCYEGSVDIISSETGDHSYKKNGKGVYIWGDGRRYEGDFVDGERTGKGVYRWKDGRRYEGDFVDGERTGQGVLMFANGDRYEGGFCNNVRRGDGVYTWADGDRYEGYFEDDATMRGVYIWANGGRYKKEFVDGIVNKKGVIKRTQNVVSLEDVDLDFPSNSCSSRNVLQINNPKPNYKSH